MSNHEFWNELGNLYFMNGAYEPAIHAYVRSIELEGTFGRSFSNLAMAYVQAGKYDDAIKLYRHSIELLPDNREKAITWNRLGILYRQVKDYNHALEAYQQADMLDPQQETGDGKKTPRDTKLPLTVSMPSFDLDSLIEKIELPPEDQAVENINAELEFAEREEEKQFAWFIGEIVSPDPQSLVNVEELPVDTIPDMRSEWRLAYENEISSIETASLMDLEVEAPETDRLSPMEFELPTEMEGMPIVEESILVDEPEAEIYEASTVTDTAEIPVLVETESESIEYSQTEYPLIELSPVEREALEHNIAKYKYAVQNNPRNNSLWEMLGDAYKAAGMFKEAIIAFQTAISINSTKASYYYRLGLIYAAQRKEAEAVGAFQRVLEIDPDYAQAHASLGSHYIKMGLTELGQAHIDKALSTEFEEESEYNRACLEAICGNNDRALELLETALKSGQTYITWALNDPDFDSLREDARFQRLLSTYAVSEVEA